jgi:hypothetical protein
MNCLYKYNLEETFKLTDIKNQRSDWLKKEIQKKLDEWLKSINDRIESEDITRFEVRFLEVLRNILEWIKEKVDAKVEAGEREKPGRKKDKGLFREIHRRYEASSEMG